MAAFDLADNTVSAPIPGPTGRVVFYVSGKQDSYVPKLDEVRSRVRDDVIQERAVDAREAARRCAGGAVEDRRRTSRRPRKPPGSKP